MIKLFYLGLVYGVFILPITAQDISLRSEIANVHKVLNFHSNYINENEKVIAVIDGGVKADLSNFHDSFWANENETSNGKDDDHNGYIDDIWGWNFAEGNNDVSRNDVGDWHGTPVNSIINSLLKIDSYDSNPVKLLNVVKGASIESIQQSLIYIYQLKKLYNQSNGAKGANIIAINCSWGKEYLFAEDYPEWCAIYDSLGNEGVLVVSSVSNNHENIDFVGDMPSTCESDFLITVTNSFEDGTKVFDAAYGLENVDISATGQNSYTMLNTGIYGYFGGTSAAAPYVSASIGLIYSLPIKEFQLDLTEKPKETALFVKKALIESVYKHKSLEEKTVSGGLLNTFNAVKLICDYYNKPHLYNDIFKSSNLLSLYPNPASDKIRLTLESNISKLMKVQILNFNGQFVIEMNVNVKKGVQNIELEINSLNTGIYFLTLENTEKRKMLKLVVK
ncbi:S8/S53 family peptidase [Marivirga tractuosa]|uniref:S8/S53 family peptidase n=1 Tax=Marivirga tractuosa TaxID=1006 RepID=UPI0035CECA29